MEFMSQKKEEAVDVVLVYPPVSCTTGPSLALGLLKAALVQEGISCRVDYADLYFTARMGVKHASIFASGNMTDFSGEYIFAGPAGIDPEYGEEELERLLSAKLTSMEWIERKKVFARAKAAAWEETERTVSRILAQNPRIVGISSCFQQRNAAIAIFRALKQKRPDIITMMGGANCFGQAGIAMLRQFPFLDYVFFGESDDIFAQVCRDVMCDPKAPLPYGVLRQGEELPQEAPHRIVTDLDALPYPDYDDFYSLISTDLGGSIALRYALAQTGRGTSELYLEGSRGCWWGEKHPCSFCGLNGNIYTYRRKSTERVFEEICYLSERYGVFTMLFTDCVMPSDWPETLAPKLKALPQKYDFFVETRSNLSFEELQSLREAGFSSMQPGIESLSSHVLRLMGKGVSALSNLSFLKHARKLNIKLCWNILCGFPGETLEDYQDQIKLIPLIEHLSPPNCCSWVIYARDNEYVTNCSKYQLSLSPSDTYRFYCPQDDAYIADIALYYDAANPISQDMQNAVRALKAAGDRWAERHVQTAGAIRLDMADLGESLVIIDTRSCRDLRAQLLVGAQREVCLACAKPCSLTYLEKTLTGLEPEEIRSALLILMRKKLMLRYGDLYLSLAVEYTWEELKQRDIAEFCSITERSKTLREELNQALKEAGKDGEAEVLTRFARKMNLCFTGEEYLAAEPVV